MTTRRRGTAFHQVCRLAGKAIADYRMIGDGDQIAVGLSWGKDSTVLTHVLRHLQQRAPVNFELHAVWVDGGFNDDERETMAAYAAQQGWDYSSVRISMERVLRDKGALESPCSLCSRLRRGKLHAAMDRLGCRTLALGHNREDLVASLLISMFRGHGLKTMAPNVPADKGSKRLIRPLCLVPEPLIVQAAQEMNLPTLRKCPFIQKVDQDGDRQFVRNLLQSLDARFLNVAQAILTSMADVRCEHLLDRRYLDRMK